MSIITTLNPKDQTSVELMKIPTVKSGSKDIINANISKYNPTEQEKAIRAEVLRCFQLGHVNLYKPRREFNDLSLISRYSQDKMAFNNYQENDGDAPNGDVSSAWKSRAVKPIIRNKIMSVAAHATARTLFPKIFAYNDNDEEQRNAAIVIEDLQEWAADQSNYPRTCLYAVITALYSPASIVSQEYAETFRAVKKEKKNGKWQLEYILDEDLSGFINEVVPVDELYIENFYEREIQRQGWLIRRRVQAYSLLKAKYENKYPNFKYVHPGIQTLLNDANQSFYDVYDINMRQEMGEEIIFYRKVDDLKIIMVNGIVLTDPDNPNPRQDKLYPFAKFGWSIIDEGRCFYYKSLAALLQQEAKIVNTMYQMTMDGTMLSVMPPMANIGGEIISRSVLVPGAVTTLSDPNADLRPITLNQNLKAGYDALFKIEESLDRSSIEPIQEGDTQRGGQTAYEISRLEQNAATVFGLFIHMIGDGLVKPLGKLMIGDILQYLTIGDVNKIEGKVGGELIYKTFYLQNKDSKGKSKTRKIKFDSNLPTEPISPDKQLELSLKVLEEQGGPDAKTELWRVNPTLIRNYKYMLTVSPDTMNPISEELQKAFKLEQFDRMVAHPEIYDPQETGKLLLRAYPETKKDVDMYLNKNPQGITEGALQNNQSSPLEMMSQKGVPQAASASKAINK